MKTLLYATDRTEQSVPMLHFAYDLSKLLGVELVVLYVHRIEHLRVPVTRRPEQIELKVIREQQEVLKSFCTTHLGVERDGHSLRYEVVSNDSILTGILQKSAQLAPDLILIGRKEKHSDRGIFAGDIGQGLLKRSPFPVLIAPNRVQHMPIQTIVYATAFEEADIVALQKLVPMAKILGAKIHIVHIASENLNSRKDKMVWFKDMLTAKIDYEKLEYKVISSDDIVKKIDSYASSINADLIAVLYREEKGFFQNLFNRSVVTTLEDHVDLPLLGFKKAD